MKKLLIIFAVAALITVTLCVGSLASSGNLGIVVAFIIALSAAFIALVAGSILMIYLKGNWKWIGVFIALGIPTILYITLRVGDSFAWDTQSKANGVWIAQALDRYRADQGSYPQSLDELRSQYIDDLHQPPSVWGWLYKQTADTFMLGYVYHVESMGYSVCSYSSSVKEWDCTPYSDPFDLPPTPSGVNS